MESVTVNIFNKRKLATPLRYRLTIQGVFKRIDMTQFERESMNFRLPKPLAQALRKAASPQPGKTATDIVIRALTKELGTIQGMDECTEVRLQKLEEELQQLRSSIQERDNTPTDSTEEKLEALNNRVARIEGALTAVQNNNFGASNNYRRYKNSGNPYNQTGRPPQIQPLDEQTLALRLNVKIPELKEKQQTLSASEFEEWSKNRDRLKYSWRFNEKSGLYHPKKSN
ncbi:hypothetical protein NIES267_74560 (plasmid) [Calothrix parasitica NIES-267]|uniref:Uncharacterized protein n=1 Tax=Calothrix parasitica NIES-267 TaxID=1973488 RepID=A0A1Z4M374_9CYAN|nr:hypothetical protein NIES267_74560 [Calothrix parasitica NIES-267]